MGARAPRRERAESLAGDEHGTEAGLAGRACPPLELAADEERLAAERERWSEQGERLLLLGTPAG